jgi:hypothetical protein
MPGQAGYNSVETLLLFQYLWSYGVSLQVFGRISEQLVNDADVRSQADFDPSRLSADALKDHFIRIVHDESKASSQPVSNGASASSPRKRKAPSPTLPTLQDVAKNLDLVPKLILKLYSRVREQIVADLRETETKYAKARQDIAAIQRGDWDAKIQDGLAEGEKLKTTVNGDSGRKSLTPRVHLEPIHPSNHYIQRTPSPTSTTIELPRTVPRPQVVINQAAPRQTPPSYSQPPYRSNAAQPQPPYTQSPTLTSKSPSLPSARQTPAQSPRLPPQPLSRGSSATPLKTSGPASSPYASVSRGGVMLQPFQVSPQVPNSVTRQPQSQPINPLQSRVGVSPFGTPVTPNMDPKARSLSNPLILSVAKSLEDPDLFRKNPPSAWKSDLASNQTQPATPSPIQIRGISPIVEPPPSPETSTRTRAKAKQEKLTTTRSSRASRRIRGASAASSIVDSSVHGRTRSQSIVSQASADETASKSIKNDPASTPQDSDMLGDETPMAAPPRRALSTRSKRKRSIPASETSAPDFTQGSRASADIEPELDLDREKMVLAVRNFPRVSNVVFAEINSHKHAGLFSNPVRERDAEGYSSMIRRPTDLKTVKAAIQAGARAINNDESANAAISASGTATSSRDATALLLPWSEDLVPPKGIVNSAQLEKELMRMFANAVMFNPGDEGVVEDATEMFEQTVVQLMQFREAEKGAEQGPIARKSEAIEEEEEESTPAQSTSKRRKVA